MINVGHHQLFPNMPNQLIQIFVTGGPLVQGLNLNVQIGDGGLEVGGTTVGPSITAVFVVDGTIFANNNTGQQDPGSYPKVAIRTVSTESASVIAEGLLAKIFITTTNLDEGTWPLALKNTLNGPTDFAGKPAFIMDGSITIIPETSTRWLLVLGTAGLLSPAVVRPRVISPLPAASPQANFERNARADIRYIALVP